MPTDPRFPLRHFSDVLQMVDPPRLFAHLASRPSVGALPGRQYAAWCTRRMVECARAVFGGLHDEQRARDR